MRPHSHPIRVYFEDTDAGGMAYHATYLRWAERARTEALREAGMPHQEMMERHGAILVVRRVEVQYVRPARLDDELDVVTGPWEVAGATVWVRQSFRVAGREIGALRVRLACVRPADGRPGRVPERWRAALGGAAPGGADPGGEG